MKTPVELFAIALYEGGYLQGNGDKIQNLLEEHLVIQKQQIIDAHWKGQDDEKDYYNMGDKCITRHIDNSIKYYNETYGGNK